MRSVIYLMVVTFAGKAAVVPDRGGLLEGEEETDRLLDGGLVGVSESCRAVNGIRLGLKHRQRIEQRTAPYIRMDNMDAGARGSWPDIKLVCIIVRKLKPSREAWCSSLELECMLNDADSLWGRDEG